MDIRIELTQIPEPSDPSIGQVCEGKNFIMRHGSIW
jgi:hypothetical protein